MIVRILTKWFQLWTYSYKSDEVVRLRTWPKFLWLYLSNLHGLYIFTCEILKFSGFEFGKDSDFFHLALFLPFPFWSLTNKGKGMLRTNWVKGWRNQFRFHFTWFVVKTNGVKRNYALLNNLHVLMSIEMCESIWEDYANVCFFCILKIWEFHKLERYESLSN